MTPALAGSYPTVPENQRIAEENKELANAQADYAQSFHKYYEALKSGASSDEASKNYLSSATNKLSGIISDRDQTNKALLTGRAFFADGTTMDLKEFNKDPGKYLKEKAPESIKKVPKDKAGGSATAEAPAPQQEQDPGAKSSAGRYTNFTSNESNSPQVQVEGTADVKELVFPGAKKAAPARNPASGK